MPKKKKSPPTASVEAVIWNDAYYTNQAKLDTSPVFNYTVGFLVHEDEKQIILAAEVTIDEDWMEADMDYTKIPMAMVVKRTKLAEVDLDINPAEENLIGKNLSDEAS